MHEHLLEPLKFYETVGKQLHVENVNKRFDELLAASGVNADENRATVKAYKQEKTLIEGVKKKISKYKLFKVLLIIACIFIITIPISIILIVKKINPLINNTEEVLAKHEARAAELLREAEAQMSPLNALFRDDDTFRLIEKTVPEIQFSERFSPDLKAFLEKSEQKVALDNAEATTITAISGGFSKNPFVFFRRLVHKMGVHTYVGTLVIRWTESYRDSQGNRRTRTRTQTLTATLTKPKPYYHNETFLCYANQAAPDLSFSRTATDTEELNEKQIERRVRRGKKKLEKKAREALENGSDFREMSNAEFDVLFGATNRDHEVQFRLIYTPLAQKNTVALLKNNAGYGDDFEFTKKKELNIIKSEHAQRWSMSTSAKNYYSYDIDVAKANFESFNNEYFRSVFFDFAPLISVPAYLDEPTDFQNDEYKGTSHYSSHEHEIIANELGASIFAPANARTSVILKTRCLSSSSEGDKVEVRAYSYATANRLDFVPVLGGDGKIHPVPVHWVEYIPVDSSLVMNVSVNGEASIK